MATQSEQPSETKLNMAEAPLVERKVNKEKRASKQVKWCSLVVALGVIIVGIIIFVSAYDKKEKFPFEKYFNETTKILTFPADMKYEDCTLSINSFNRVEQIVFDNSPFGKVQSISMYGLGSLRSIMISGSDIFADANVFDLHDLPSLRSITVEGENIFPSLPELLITNLPNLKELRIAGTLMFSNVTSVTLSKLNSLSILGMVNDVFAKAQKLTLNGLPMLTELIMDDPRVLPLCDSISFSGLAFLQTMRFGNDTLPSLTSLDISYFAGLMSVDFVGDRVLYGLQSLNIHDNPLLKTINVNGMQALFHTVNFTLSDLPRLNTLVVDGDSSMLSASLIAEGPLNADASIFIKGYRSMYQGEVLDLLNTHLHSLVISGEEVFFQARTVRFEGVSHLLVQGVKVFGDVKSVVINGSQLKSIEITGECAFESTVLRLENSPYLETMKLHANGLFGLADSFILRGLPALKVLDLHGGTILREARVLDLIDLHELETFKAFGLEIGYNVVNFTLSNLPSLSLFSVEGGEDNFRNVYRAVIKDCSSLKKIYIQGYNAFLGPRYLTVENLPKLEMFHIVGYRVFYYLEHLNMHNLPNLKQLMCESAGQFYYAIEIVIKGMPSLETIYLGAERAMYYTTKLHIADMPKLAVMTLTGKEILNEAEVILENMPLLESLRIYGQNIGVESLGFSMHNIGLKELEFDCENMFSGAKSLTLTNFPNLETLKFKGAMTFSDVSEFTMSSMPKLKSLSISGEKTLFSSSLTFSDLSADTEIDVSGDYNLYWAQTIDFTRCPALKSLLIRGTNGFVKTTSLKLGGASVLVVKDVSAFRTELTISESPSLEAIYILGNDVMKATALSVIDLPALKEVLVFGDATMGSSPSFVLKDVPSLKNVDINGEEVMYETKMSIVGVAPEAVVKIRGTGSLHSGSLDLSKSSIKQLELSGDEVLFETQHMVFGEMESLVISGDRVLSSILSFTLRDLNLLKEVDITGERTAVLADSVTLLNLPELHHIVLGGNSTFASASAVEFNGLNKLESFSIESESVLASLGNDKGYVKMRVMPLVNSVEMGPGVDYLSSFYRMKYLYRGPSVSDVLYNGIRDYIKTEGKYKHELVEREINE